MANLKRGLGKSFNKIFGEGVINETTFENTQANENAEAPVKEVIKEVIKEKIVEVPTGNAEGTPLYVNINYVQANVNQPRKTFNEDALKELAESIENYGIVEPLIVRKVGPVHYEVIAGERRLRAAKIAGLDQVPVIVKEYDDKTRKEIAIIENVQREDLNAVEKAMGYKELIEEYNMTQEELAVKLGKSRAAITNTMRILQLDQNIINMIIEGKLSEGHARALLSIDDEAFRNKVVEKVIKEKLSVRKIEDMIRLDKLVKYRKDKEEKQNTDTFKSLKIQIKDIEKQMKSKLNAGLKVLPKNEKEGVIEIKWNSVEELDRIYLLINSIQQNSNI